MCRTEIRRKEFSRGGNLHYPFPGGTRKGKQAVSYFEFYLLSPVYFDYRNFLFYLFDIDEKLTGVSPATK